jgi:hypothetical protein
VVFFQRATVLPREYRRVGIRSMVARSGGVEVRPSSRSRVLEALAKYARLRREKIRELGLLRGATEGNGSALGAKLHNAIR